MYRLIKYSNSPNRLYEQDKFYFIDSFNLVYYPGEFLNLLTLDEYGRQLFASSYLVHAIRYQEID